MKFKIALFFFVATFFIACGYKAPPEPLFGTSPSNVDTEVTRRKNEKKKPQKPLIDPTKNNDKNTTPP